MFKEVIFVIYVACAYSYPAEKTVNMTIITREEWGARNATRPTVLSTPVPLVIVHHSSVPEACYTTEDCQQAMRQMQDMHQKVNDWSDIGYNFAVGSDGLIYEGRGWDTLGAHAASFNNRSIGIVLIGHWVSEVPPRYQLYTAQNLINLGVSLGYIKPDYTLLGHRQVGSTECPGQALFEVLKTWRHFQIDATGLTSNNSTPNQG